MSSVRGHIRYLGALALCVTLGHGLLVLMDGVYWDSWTLYTAYLDGDWARVDIFYAEGGVPWFSIFHQLLSNLSGFTFSYHLLAFLCILGSTWLVYWICIRSGYCTRFESFWVAALSSLFPAFQVAFQQVMLTYLIAYFLFLLAIVLAIKHLATHRRFSVWRVGALVLFALSFTTGSLLVYFFGFVALLFFLTPLPALTPRGLSSFVTGNLDYLILPFLYWFGTRALFPNFGERAGYNRFELGTDSLVLHAGNFLANAGWAPLVTFYSIGTALLSLVVAIGLAQVLYPHWVGDTRSRARRSASNVQWIGFGICLFVLAALPYVIVGKSPNPAGWSTRHALLSGLPMAILLVGIVRGLWYSPHPLLPRLALTVLCFLVFTFGIHVVTTYWDWQARWIKDQSLILNLRAFPQAEAVSTFWVQDKFPKTGDEDYRYYEWSSLFKTAWGNESHLGTADSKQRRESNARVRFQARYNLATYDPKGCNALLRLEPGPTAQSSLSPLSYFSLKLLGANEPLNQALRAHTRITITSFDRGQAKICPTLHWQNSP